MASSIERTCHSQYPATSSLASANGPSITVRLLPSNRTRFPSGLGVRRPEATTTPALTSSSLNFWCAAMASGVGGVAASLRSPSFAITSTRIPVSSLDQVSSIHRMTCGLFDIVASKITALRLRSELLASHEVEIPANELWVDPHREPGIGNPFHDLQYVIARCSVNLK